MELSAWVQELRRRRVFRALVGYGIASFAILQIVEPVMHGLRLPEWTLTAVVVALGIGFPITVALAWVFDLKATGIERTHPAAPGGRARWLLLGLGVAAAAPIVIWYFALRPSAARGRDASIAVLPFEDMSATRDQGYFADGMAEEILNLLARVEGLRVAGRTSSFVFRGTREDARAIGEKLNVGTLLEGSVRKEGNRVRITAQLLDARDGFHLWSQTFDREVAGVLAAQDDIAQAVVGALKPRLGAATARAAGSRTSNPEAYNEYLLGKQFFNRLNLADYRRAQAAFEKAVALDPSFAPAWAGLAMARFWVADEAASGAQIAEGHERAMAAAEKAIALDPTLSDGFSTRGFLRTSVTWDWEGARADYERGLALNPSDAEAHRRFGAGVLASLGRLQDAVFELRKATEIDPLSAVAWSSLGRVLYSSGQFDAATAALRRSLEIAPDQNYASAHLCLVLLLEKRPVEALAAAERSTSAIFRPHCRAMALHDAGRQEEAQRTLAELIAKFAHSGAYQIAESYAWFGDRERAFDWLERSYRQHDSGMGYIKADVLLRNLHGDPRFAAMLRKLKLPADGG